MYDTMDKNDRDYLDHWSEGMEKKMDTVVSSVDVIKGEMVEVKIQTALNEDRLKEHIKNDQNKESKSQWTVGNIITIIVCIASIFGAAFL